MPTLPVDMGHSLQPGVLAVPPLLFHLHSSQYFACTDAADRFRGGMRGAIISTYVGGLRSIVDPRHESYYEFDGRVFTEHSL